MPAEKAHYFTLNNLKRIYNLPFGKSIIENMFGFESPKLEKQVFGLKFKNPVGLAAGFDKNAMYIDELSALGFGFIEIGTVTPLPQEGNPQPRLFRLKEDEAIINRMGFNNDGVDAVVERLKKRESDIIIGGNIGKNKNTPNDKAIDDYVICFNKLFNYVDYFVVNVSSPNTPNLRELQEKDKLFEILNTLQQINIKKEHPKPILLKIAPDLSENQLLDILSVINEANIAGLISNNTTISREGLQTSEKEVEEIGAGGLSGKPITERSNEVLQFLIENNKTNIPIIAVGGIMNAQDAKRKITMGAALVQIYSGFIYKGPELVKEIKKELV